MNSWVFEWVDVAAASIEVGDVVCTAGVWRVVVRVSLSVDGSRVKIQFGNDSRDWWPADQLVSRLPEGRPVPS